MSIGGAAQKGERGHLVKNRDVIVRTASAAILVSIALAATYFGGVVAGIVVALFTIAVQLEWSRITRGTTKRAIVFACATGLAIIVASAGMVFAGCAIALSAAVVAAICSREIWLPGGVVYASFLGLSLIAIREGPAFGVSALLLVFVVVWATDSGAYFAGRVIGGAKLWPAISPKKTWSGAIGGLVTAAFAGLLATKLMAIPITASLFGVVLVLSVLCQVGDLFESWVKRRFGAKDSGSVIPGHGGVMDRVDGLVFAAAAAVVIGGANASASGISHGLLIW